MGPNSLKTFSVIMESLKQVENSSSPPLEIVLEEHPSSDSEKLIETLRRHENWFKIHNVTYSVLLKSFYEPLFGRESMDFIMCLHWLDPSFALPNWMSPHIDSSPKDEFVFVNETTASSSLKEVWRRDLANRHLAKFLSLRAQELRPAHPHEFVCPATGYCSPLTNAMKGCIEQGTLRKEVLAKTIIPYYQREIQDIYNAIELMHSTAEPPKGVFLEIVDIQAFEAITGDGTGTFDGTCELYWAIHGSAVRNSGGATEEESTSYQDCFETCIRRTVRSKPGDYWDVHSICFEKADS
jgi:hypothetical protein